MNGWSGVGEERGGWCLEECFKRLKEGGGGRDGV